MEPKAGRKGRRWSEIVDAAAEVFARQGFDATTVRDIAERVGMLPGSLYYYIESKADLLLAVIEQYHQEGRREIAAVESHHRAVGSDPLTTLGAILHRHVEVNASNIARSAVFYNEFRRLDHARRHEIALNRREHQRRLEGLLERARAEGTVRSDIDPTVTALSILSMVNSLYQWYGRHVRTDPSELATAQVALLLHGLRA